MDFGGRRNLMRSASAQTPPSSASWIASSIRLLPIEHPERVVFLASSWKGGHASTAFSYADFREIGEQTPNIFSEVIAIRLYQADGGEQRSQQPVRFFRGALQKVAARSRQSIASGAKTSLAQSGQECRCNVSQIYWRSAFN
jgi:hypothetical protein